MSSRAVAESIISQLPMAIPRDALADRANQMLKKLGQGSGVADRATGFHFDGDYLRWAQKNGPPAWWTDLGIGRPAALIFWYRTSPETLAPSSPASRVSARNPPVTLPGMQQLFLDTEGRLVEFHSVPPAIALESAAADAPWPALFEAAELDARTLAPASPKWLPPVFADATAAWEGPMPGRCRYARAHRGGLLQKPSGVVSGCVAVDRAAAHGRFAANRLAAADGRDQHCDLDGDACGSCPACTEESSRAIAATAAAPRGSRSG